MVERTATVAKGRELFVIDGALPDIGALISSIPSDKKLLILDPTQDGVIQIADWLKFESNLDAIHILSHGTAGNLKLGSAILNSASLDQYSDALATLGSALSGSGDLLLYGCKVAEGHTGQSFIEALAAATRADISASTDLTGETSLGGNWRMESVIGSSDTTAFVPEAALPLLLEIAPTTVQTSEYALLSANAYGLSNKWSGDLSDPPEPGARENQQNLNSSATNTLTIPTGGTL